MSLIQIVVSVGAPNFHDNSCNMLGLISPRISPLLHTELGIDLGWGLV